MKKFCFGCLFLLACFTIYAQDNSLKIDSLEKLIKIGQFKTPKEKLKVLSNLTEEYMESNLIKAESTANVQIKIAQQLNDKEFETEANENLAQIFYYKGNNDTALYLHRKAYSFYKTNNNIQNKYHVLNNIGNIFKNTGKFDSAIIIYNEVLKYYESVNNKEWEAKLLANIGSLYYTAGNAVKGKEYMLKAIIIQRTLTDKSGLGVSLVNLMVFALNAGEYKDGIKYGDESLSVLKEVNRSYYASALIRVGYCYYMEKNHQKAIQYTLEAIKINEEDKNTVGMMESYRTIADYYVEQKQYLKAKDIGLKALHIADTTNRFEIRHIYDLLKRVSIYLNEPEDAIKYSDLQIKVIEEFLNKDWAEKISETDIKYQTEKKEKDILQLTSVKKHHTLLIYSLLGFIILGGMAVFFIFRNIYQGKTIANQRVRQLEKEKQLMATQAVLQGEEAERARLARDLHDGLGGLLSGVKISLTSLKGGYAISDENVKKFDTTLNLLDTSIKEMRRISHNMMPEALIKFGLNDALGDFCNSVDNKNIDINFQCFGVDKRYDPKIENSLYRIAQELINNSLKHSQASEIIVQLIQEENRVNITVQDNGNGFDASILLSSKNSGIANVRSRVEALNGRFDLHSELGKGTEVSVEFNS